MSEARLEDLRDRVRSEVLPASAAVVIRGGPDTLSLLAAHARRLNRLYVLDGVPVFGVSVFVARGELGPASERSILTGKLRSYPTVYRTTVSRLSEAGFVLIATFADPHYTVVLPGLDAVGELAAAFGELVPNLYAEGRKEER